MRCDAELCLHWTGQGCVCDVAAAMGALLRQLRRLDLDSFEDAWPVYPAEDDPRTRPGWPFLRAELITPVQDMFDEMLTAGIERYNARHRDDVPHRLQRGRCSPRAAYPLCSTPGCSQPAGHPPPCDQRATVTP